MRWKINSSCQWTTAMLLLVMYLPVAAHAAFSCTSVPTALNGGATPVAAGSGNLSIGNNSTLSTTTTACATPNGTTCTNAAGNDTTLTQGSGVGPPSQTLPPFQPTTFPSVGTTDVTNAHNTTRAEGSYRKVTTSGTVTFSGGTYYIDELIADKSGSNNPTLKMAAGDYFINKFSATNNFTLQVTSGPVRIYIKTSWSVGNDASINAGGLASNFQLYLYDGGSVQFGNNANSNTSVDFSGMIYAPGTGTSIQMGNNNVIQGAVLSGGDVQLGNNVGVIFDATTQAAIASINTCGLLAEYRFDACSWTSGTAGAATDSSGNARHGTPYNVALSSGKIGNAADLTANGTTDYLTYPYQVVHGKSDFTATFWFKTAVSKTQQEIIQALGTSSVSDDAFEIYLVNSTQVVVNFKDSADLIFTAPSTLTNNAWHHLAVTRSGTSGCLYIDGTLVQCKTYSSGSLSVNSSAFLSGQEQDAYGSSFNTGQNLQGALDEIKFFLGALTASDISTIYSRENSGLGYDGSTRTDPCAASLHHVRIEHDGTGGVCTREPVTFKACNDSTCSSLGSVTLTPTVSPGTGVWYDAVSGGNVVTTIVLSGSAVTHYLDYTRPVNMTLGAGSFSVAPTNGVKCDITTNGTAANSTTECVNAFSSLSFKVEEDINSLVAGTGIAVAGRSHDMRVTAVRYDGTSPLPAGCGALTSYAPGSIKAYITRDVTNDPGGVAPTIGGTTVPATAGTGFALTFTNGVATFNLDTTDVGKYSLNLLDDSMASASASVTGSQGFTVRPFALDLNVSGNTGATADNGAIVGVAGSNLSTTVRGVLWQSGDDANNDGVPDSSASLTNNTTTPSYDWATVLSASAPFTPSGGALGALTGSTSIAQGQFNNDATTGAETVSLVYSEVGSFTLNAAATNYLGTSGLNLSASGIVGRLIPDHFDVTVSEGACVDGFTYSGQPLTVTVKAFALGGTVPLHNYDSGLGFSKAVSLSELNGIAGSLSPASVAASAFTAGVASATPAFTFTTVPTTQSTIKLRAIDTDNVSTAGGTTESTATMDIRSGRLRLLSAYGSELLPLRVPVQAEYYVGSNAWKINTSDTCTAIAANTLQIGSIVKPASSLAFSTPATGVTISALQSGVGYITITPSTTGTGSADVLLNLGGTVTTTGCATLTSPVGGSAPASSIDYLAGNWCGTGYDKAPVSRIKFGSPKAPYIYLRERY